MPWLLDRLTLRPTRHTIELVGADRRLCNSRQQPFELITRRVNVEAVDEAELLVCKFIGAGGRARISRRIPSIAGTICVASFMESIRQDLVRVREWPTWDRWSRRH